VVKEFNFCITVLKLNCYTLTTKPSKLQCVVLEIISDLRFSQRPSMKMAVFWLTSVNFYQPTRGNNPVDRQLKTEAASVLMSVVEHHGEEENSEK
jgi:hypothetical protein